METFAVSVHFHAKFAGKRREQEALGMGVKAWAIALCAILVLAGCSRTWQVAYDEPIDGEVSSDWQLAAVIVVVPDTLSVSEL